MKTDTDLRLLVDIVWGHATESTTVPATETADMLIAKYRQQASPPLGTVGEPRSDQPSNVADYGNSPREIQRRALAAFDIKEIK